MVIVEVFFHIKPECREAFIRAALDNARHSLQEPGVARFDVLMQDDDPNRFVLYEAYRDEQDIARHKETAHYGRWAADVEAWLAEPRSRLRFTNLFPGETGWDSTP